MSATAKKTAPMPQDIMARKGLMPLVSRSAAFCGQYKKENCNGYWHRKMI